MPDSCDKILYFSLKADNEVMERALPPFTVTGVSSLKQAVMHIAAKKTHLVLVSDDVPDKEAFLLLKMLNKHRPDLKMLLLRSPADSSDIGIFSEMDSQKISLCFGEKSGPEIFSAVCTLLGRTDLLTQTFECLDPETLSTEAGISLQEELVKTVHFSGLAEKEPSVIQEDSLVSEFVLPDSDVLSGYPKERRLLDPVVKIIVARDDLSARLVCYPTDYYHTLDGIKSELSAAGVLFGINQKKIEELLVTVNRDREPVLGAVVAVGNPPVNGRDARIDYNFSSPDELLIKENEEGKVDYKSVKEIPSVRKGDVLAVVSPPTEPQHGCGVTGKPLKGKRGRHLRMLPGRGVIYNNDNCCFYAEIDGYVNILGNRIQVTPLYSVPYDVDYSTGNIDFVGTVVVNGNITSGFSVRAEGDVLVQGVIESSACVYAAGNVKAKGVISGEKGRVEAKGEVRVGWCQDANIVAEKDVHVVDVALNSRISSMGYVHVHEKKGAVIGGVVRAVKGMRVKQLGSRLEVPTLVVSGENFRIMELVGELNRLQKINKQNQQKILLGLKSAHQSGLQDPIKMAKFKKLSEICKTLEKKDAEFEIRKKDLIRRMEERSFARIQVKDTVFGNTRVQIGTSTFRVLESLRTCSFHDDGAYVRIGPYDAS